MGLHAKDLFHKAAFLLGAYNEKAEYLLSKIIKILEEYKIKNFSSLSHFPEFTTIRIFLFLNVSYAFKIF